MEQLTMNRGHGSTAVKVKRPLQTSAELLPRFDERESRETISAIRVGPSRLQVVNSARPGREQRQRCSKAPESVGANHFFWSPSPLRGEGWGEGYRSLRKPFYSTRTNATPPDRNTTVCGRLVSAARSAMRSSRVNAISPVTGARLGVTLPRYTEKLGMVMR